jgi:tetratricopeptide (TPR) repeat protein
MNIKDVLHPRALGAIVLAISLSGCASSPEARRDKFLARGKEFLQKKDYTRAALEFRNAIKAKPRDAEAYYQLGLVSLASGDLPTAVGSFRRAIDVNPKHTGAQLKLAQLMAQAKDQALLKNAESRLQTLKQDSPSNPEVLNTLALTELKLGKTGNAVESLEESLAKAPQSLSSSIMLAEAKLAENKPKDAENALKKACDAAPGSADPRIVLGQFYFSQKRYSEAEAEYRRALTIDPKSASALMNLGRLQFFQGRKSEAEKNFKRVSELNESNYNSAYALFLLEEGRRNEAIRELERLVKARPDDRLARTRLIAVYRDANRMGDAQRILDEALRKNPKDLDALLQRSELFLSAAKYRQAETDLNRVISLQPNSAEAHYVLAQLYLARHVSLSYKQELTEALRLNPYLLSVRLELARSFLTGKAPQAALEVLDAAPAGQKQLVPLLVERNWVLWSSGNYAEMRKGIDLGLSHERSADLIVQDGVWKLHAGNAAGARAALEEALKLNPTSVQALMALNGTYASQKQDGAALQKVKEYAARQPQSAPVQQFLGSMLLAHGDRAQARAAFIAAKAADPQWTQADISLIQLDALENKWDDADARIKSVLSAEPNNMDAHLWFGNVQMMKGNFDAAIEQFRRVTEIDPDNPLALNNMAFLLNYRKQSEEALKYAQKAMELSPNDPDIADTLGWILYEKGLYPSALQYFERANSQGDNAAWKYHLAMAYAKSGNSKLARETFELAMKRDPKAPEARQAAEVIGQAK